MNLVESLIDKWSETKKQEDLAALLNVAPSRLSQWKSNLRPIPVDQFWKLCEIVEGATVGQRLLWLFVQSRYEERRIAQRKLELE